MVRSARPNAAGLLAAAASLLLGGHLLPAADEPSAAKPASAEPSPAKPQPAEPENKPLSADVLKAQAEELAKQYVARLGDHYAAEIDARHHLVYISALDAKMLRRVRRLLAAQLAAHRKTLFPQPLARNVVVVLPTAQDYPRLAGRPKALGRYSRTHRCLVTMTLGSVLRHEFTHAVHHNDEYLAAQQHALWVAEAFATLYQYADTKEGRLVPRRGGALARVQEAVRKNETIPLARLVRMDSAAFTEQADVAYPQVRWLALYLHARGRLAAFYQRYKSTWADDPTGAAALEGVLDTPLAKVEADWRAWILDQEPPWRPGWDAVAHLGIRMQDREQGVRVDSLPRGSSAAAGGQLRVGDIILTVAGRPTPDPADLREAVRSCKPGQTVLIEVLRDGRTTIVPQVLGAVRRPRTPAHAAPAPSDADQP